MSILSRGHRCRCQFRDTVQWISTAYFLVKDYSLALCRNNAHDPVLRIRPIPGYQGFPNTFQNRGNEIPWGDRPMDPSIPQKPIHTFDGVFGGRSASHRPGMPDFAHPQQGAGQDGPDSCSQRGAWRLTPWPMCAKNVDNRVALNHPCASDLVGNRRAKCSSIKHCDRGGTFSFAYTICPFQIILTIKLGISQDIPSPRPHWKRPIMC